MAPALSARLRERYGAGSPAARADRQRYFVDRTLALQYLLLNSRRALFATARMRRAVNFALDRSALAATAGPGFFGLPTDQYLPTGLPGFRDADIYPLGGPDVARARSLAGTRGAVTPSCTPATTPRACAWRRPLGPICARSASPSRSSSSRSSRCFAGVHPGGAVRHRLVGMVGRLRGPVGFMDIASVPGLDARFTRDAPAYRRRIASPRA